MHFPLSTVIHTGFPKQRKLHFVFHHHNVNAVPHVTICICAGKGKSRYTRTAWLCSIVTVSSLRCFSFCRRSTEVSQVFAHVYWCASWKLRNFWTWWRALILVRILPEMSLWEIWAQSVSQPPLSFLISDMESFQNQAIYTNQFFCFSAFICYSWALNSILLRESFKSEDEDPKK